MHKWHEIADTLAAAMQHSEKGICTLTENEHAALKVYIDARRPGRMTPRTMLGLTGGLDAFRHDDHAPDAEFVVTGDGSDKPLPPIVGFGLQWARAKLPDVEG